MDIRALRRKFPPIVKKTGEIHAIVETPQGSRNKFTFEPQAQVFQLGFAMPTGFEFPFNLPLFPAPSVKTAILWISWFLWMRQRSLGAS